MTQTRLGICRVRTELENFSVPPVPSPAESRDEETIPPVRAPAARKIPKLTAHHPFAGDD